jgi:hypothetical protein
MTEDLINAMKELVRCYESANDRESATNKEIEMWRDRFIRSIPRLVDLKKDMQMTAHFLCLPSEEIIKRPVEQWIELIKGVVNEN